MLQSTFSKRTSLKHILPYDGHLSKADTSRRVYTPPKRKGRLIPLSVSVRLNSLKANSGHFSSWLFKNPWNGHQMFTSICLRHENSAFWWQGWSANIQSPYELWEETGPSCDHLIKPWSQLGGSGIRLHELSPKRKVALVAMVTAL